MTETKAPTEYTHRQIQVIMSGLMLGVLLAALDQTIMATALTTIARDFHRLDLYSWVVTSYLLTSTVTTPLYGKVSDQFGRKHIFMFAIVVFLVGSAICGFSQNMYQLIIFRGIQGIGAGGLISLALSIVGDVIPPRDRGRYQGYFGAVFGAASVIGPLIGGFLVDEASWRWVFYVNIPIGLVALVVINRVLHLDHNPIHRSIDYLGALLLVGGVSLILVAVQNVGTTTHLSTNSTIFAIVGVLLVAAFVFWETRAKEPILPLRLFRNSVFTVSATLSLITGAVMFGAILFLPQYMQIVRGVSPTVSGLKLLPLLVGLLLTSIGSGRIISAWGRYKIFVVSGTAIVTIGYYLLAQIKVDTNAWLFAGMLFVVGFGIGMFMQTLVLSTQNSIVRSDMGTATSAITFARTLGGAIGASVLGAGLIDQEKIFARSATNLQKYGHQIEKYAFVHGMDRAYMWSIPVTLISFIISFLLKEIRLKKTLGESGAAEALG